MTKLLRVAPHLGLVCLCLLVTACSRGASLAPESRLGSRPDDRAGATYGRGTGRDGGVERGNLPGGPGGQGAQAALKAASDDLVYFSTDSTDLTPEARSTLQAQAQWLQRHPTQAVTIEGHADERGTREYNIALGGRRAATVKSYLVALGVDGARIRTTSLGKERPVAVCNDISCWSQNRRAQTILTTVAVSRN